MHILIITPEYLPHPGGISTYYQALAQCLQSTGENVTLAYFETYPSRGPAPKSNFQTVNLTDERSALQVAADRCFPGDHPLVRSVLASGLAARRWLRKALPKDSFDLVVTADFLGLGSFLSGPEFPPLLVTAHGTLGQMQYHSPASQSAPDRQRVQAWETLSLQQADFIHAYSPANTTFWQEQGYADIGFTRPPWVLGEDTPPSSRSASPSYILCAGRLQSWKGPEQVLRALKHIPVEAGMPEIHWYGGDTQDPVSGEPLSLKLAREYPESWGTRFQWKKPVPREELKQLRSRAFACLVPSLWDTLNFTALEALDSATPLILSTAAGAAYLIENGHNGFTFTPDSNGQALAESLRQLLALGDKERQAMGQQGREHLQSHLTPGSVHTDFLEAASQAIARRQQREKSGYPMADAGAIWETCVHHFDNKGWKQNHSLREWGQALQQEVKKRLIKH